MDFNSMFRFYQLRHDALVGTPPGKDEINSSLSECNLAELDEQINSDDELRQFLYTPASELPQQYLYLITEIFPEALKYTLYDLMEFTFSYKNTVSYFSKAGDKIIGWCGYHISKDVDGIERVDEIKMFSFDLSKPNPVLLRDLQSLLDDLLEKYSSVSWTAVKENPANRIYESVLDKYKREGFQIKTNDDGKTIIYKIFKGE